MTETIFDQIRAACKAVAGLSTHVRINYAKIPAYASSLPVEKAATCQLDPNCHFLGRKKDTVAFLLILDSINFGSGYFPHLRKRPGLSGYFTIASSLHDFCAANGAPAADHLAAITAEECTRIFDQDPNDTIIAELMAHFSAALNDLGRYLLDRFQGSFTGLVAAADASAARLVHLLRQMPYYNDVEWYANRQVPFFKRAQIVAADLALAFDGLRWGHFHDLDQMTIFADNLLPHVLRMDGILDYEDALLNRINAQILIAPGSAEEVEIRACAVHAVELIKDAMRAGGKFANARQLDNLLWNRGRQPQYKAVPRHRTRTVYY